MMYMKGLLTLLTLFAVVHGVAAQDYFQPNATGIKLQNGFERVYIQPFGNHGIRVRASLLRDPTGHEPSALLDPPLSGPGGSAGLAHSLSIPFQGSGSFRNGNILAQITNGTLTFHRIEPNGTSTFLTGEFVDTKAPPARAYTQDFRSSSFEASFGFASEEGEMFFGAGQQACCADHSVNKKGQVVDLVNWNSHVTLPVWMSSKGYLQFFNMPGQGRIEFDRLRTRFVAHEATVVDYWITTAQPGDYDALQEQYTAVTGRQPTPPQFALGYQQSKLRYYNQSQVLDVVQRFHDEKVNVSLIVVDFFAWKFQGDWSFNPEFWPDPAFMASEVKRLTGAEMMVSLWPSVEDNSVNYLSLQQEGLLATTRDGPGVQDSFDGVYTRLVDSTNPAAREFLWKRLNDSYFSKGIHNFWIDQDDGGTLGEAFENNGQTISSIPYARSFAQYFLGTQEKVGKMYPWLHQQAIEEGLHNLTDTPSSDTSCKYMSLTRSTFAGGQRFCSYLWSGDTDSKFDVLLQQITAGVSVAASGISSWTLDIGGFSGLDIDSDYGKELFVRWLAMGTFLPYMRVHGLYIPVTDTQAFANPCPNEPWSYGEDNFQIIKQYISLRYQLVPYMQKLFEHLQETGKTIMRPLYYDFSSDSMVVKGTKDNDPSIIHQFMLGIAGSRLLVAPVGTQGATMQEVYLPLLWTEKDFGSGGKSVNISAGLEQIPIFYLGSKDDIFSGNV
ncbi:glycoside hydrolase family 31 protein [Cyathus striatus]|nr:glycoside hydrolase family 31 protein [Cyathus striatus]